VSVGTLYQYYPNKQSLLFAVLEHHLETVAAAVEDACRRAHGKPLGEMVRAVVEAFVSAKMARADISTALYRIAGDVGGPVLVKRINQRWQRALLAAVGTASDAVVEQAPFAIQLMVAAMAGATRAVLEAGASPPMVRKLRDHLVLLCQSYMAAIARPRPAR
jgi:AcrR family transcriptional regulator